MRTIGIKRSESAARATSAKATPWSVLGGLVLAWLACTPGAFSATVTAKVDPPEVRPNQIAVYTITVEDGGFDAVPQPRVPPQIGFNSGPSASQQLSITNGVQKIITSMSWRIAATEPGEFVIPPQDVSINGAPVKTNEVKLVVKQGATATEDDTDPNQPLLQLEMGKTEFYQGEVVPISASLFLPRQIGLRRLGLIELDKSAFAIQRFPQQSEQNAVTLKGQSYYVLTFRSTLSALRTGDLKVGPATMEILVEVPMENNGFAPPFFGVPTEPRKISVRSQSINVKVLPLPAENRPAGFSGAVGEFTLSASASPDSVQVGDPISVELAIDGVGNFDALTEPKLTSAKDWKTYPARRYNIEGPTDPNIPTTEERKIGYSLVLVPEREHKEVPPFELSFFSPSRKQYITLRTKPVPITITPNPAATAPGGGETKGSGGDNQTPRATDPVPEIGDILMHLPPSPTWLPLRHAALISTPKFWLINGLPLLMLAIVAGMAWARRRKLSEASDPRRQLEHLLQGLEAPGLSRDEFYRRAAHFIHSSHATDDASVQPVLAAYEATNFSGASAAESRSLSSEERAETLRLLRRLLDAPRSASLIGSTSSTAAALLIAFSLHGSESAQAAPSPAAATPIPVAIPSDPDEAYRQAAQALSKREYSKAEKLAESIVHSTPPRLSPEVFELLGHARYRQADLGGAVLWYQRSQLLSPRVPEVRQNLRHLHDKLRFLSFQSDSPLTAASLMLTRDEWAILAAAGFWLVMLALIWRTAARKGRHGVWTIGVAVVGWLLLLPCATFGALRPSAPERVTDLLVVTAKDARAHTAAATTSPAVIDLPAGSEVRRLEKRGAWLYVEIPNQPEALRGWLLEESAAPLWPWDAGWLP